MGSFSGKVNKGIIEVNGETYYDIRYALNTYENDVKNLRHSLKSLKEKIREREEEMELLDKEFPTLKKAIEEWQKYEREE